MGRLPPLGLRNGENISEFVSVLDRALEIGTGVDFVISFVDRFNDTLFWNWIAVCFSCVPDPSTDKLCSSVIPVSYTHLTLPTKA